MVLRIVRVVDPFSANEFDDQLAVNVGVSRACTEPGAGSATITAAATRAIDRSRPQRESAW